MCTHSDLWSYKNLSQSELLQQELTAAAEQEETLSQTTERPTVSVLPSKKPHQAPLTSISVLKLPGLHYISLLNVLLEYII